MSFAVLKLVFTAAVLVTGVTLAWWYGRRPTIPRDPRAKVLAGQRPWRRLSGAMCLVLSVMFAFGVYVVDVPDHPRVYLAYWTVMMGLVLWLCALATKDVFYTREVLARRRAASSGRDELVEAVHLPGKGEAP